MAFIGHPLFYGVSMTKYVSIENNIVTYIGTRTEKENTEPTIQWIMVDDDVDVQIGYRYDKLQRSFSRVRQSVQTEKQNLLAKVNYIYDQTSKKILADFPEEEVKTFPFQVMELLAYPAYLNGDAAAEPIMLKAIAHQRGVSLEDIILRLRGLSNQLRFILGTVVGMRQHLEDEIRAATTHHRLDILSMEVAKFAKGEYKQ